MTPSDHVYLLNSVLWSVIGLATGLTIGHLACLLSRKGHHK